MCPTNDEALCVHHDSEQLLKEKCWEVICNWKVIQLIISLFIFHLKAAIVTGLIFVAFLQ